jgi:hypothetical protein
MELVRYVVEDSPGVRFAAVGIVVAVLQVI